MYRASFEGSSARTACGRRVPKWMTSPGFRDNGATVGLDLEGALKVNKLIDALEDSDDVQNIYTNMSLSDEVRAQLEEQE